MILNEKSVSEYSVRTQYNSKPEKLLMKLTNYRMIITLDTIKNARFRFFYQDINCEAKSKELNNGNISNYIIMIDFDRRDSACDQNCLEKRKKGK